MTSACEASKPKPDAQTSGEMSFAAQLSLWLLRQWHWGRYGIGRPPARFWEAWQRLGDTGAGLRFDVLASLLAGRAPRPLHVLPPCALRISADEQAFLGLLAAWQAQSPGVTCLAARLVPYERQGRLLHWAGSEVAQAMLVCGLDLTCLAPPPPQTRFTFASAAKSL